MSNALNSQSSLYEAGFPVYIRTVTIHNKEYHRVFISPNLSLEEAKGFEQELKSIMQVKLYPSTHRFAQ
jgi:cell division septation protein DedD